MHGETIKKLAVIMFDVIKFYVHFGPSLKLWQGGIICVVKMVQTFP